LQNNTHNPTPHRLENSPTSNKKGQEKGRGKKKNAVAGGWVRSRNNTETSERSRLILTNPKHYNLIHLNNQQQQQQQQRQQQAHQHTTDKKRKFLNYNIGIEWRRKEHRYRGKRKEKDAK